MNKLKSYFVSLFFVVNILSPAFCQSQSNLTRFVDPFIGTENGGNVFLGVAVPFGMVKLGPDCGNNDNNSGYYRDQNINGFSHTHVSGSGGGAKYGNILVMPESGELQISQFSSPRTDEVAKAGYYSAFISRYNVKAELTATASVGFHRYTFPEGQTRHILIDAGHFLEVGREWGESQEFIGSEIRILSNHEIEGYSRIRGGWNKGGAYTVYFYAVFDQKASETGTWKNGILQKGTTEQPDTAEKTGSFLSFVKTSGKTVQVKVGISFISAGKAKLNVETQIPGWNFDEVHILAEKAWNSELEKITVEGGSGEYKKMFYTALYHSMLMPVKRTGENPLWKSDEPYYDDLYAIWDTYRTTHPLMTLINPEIQRDMVRSMIDIYRHEGYMPDARSGNVTGRTQGGSNSDLLIADAFVKGLKEINYETAFQAMIKNAEVPPGGNEQKEGRGGIPDYNSLGYVSIDYERAGTRTVEYSACDYAIATVAKGLGKTELYEKYLKRSSNWKNLWRPVESYGAKGFIWPRKKDGTWEEKFSALQPGSWSDFFYESQSWELSFYVPQDVAGLIEMCGGPKAFESRLDTFFLKSKPNDSGWMDFYNVNNEPGFLTPTLYNFIGKQSKSNAQVRQIISKYFNCERGGLPGNDDSGAMSSWLIFQLMGFYPVAGQDLYLIAAPYFEKTRILILSMNLISYAQSFQPNWASLDKRPIPQWYTDAKFGIFIHWGVYSVPAWAPASADIGVYAKYAEWYWPRINGGKDPNKQQGDVNKLFLDYHNKVWGEKFKYQDFAPMFKAEQFQPDQWAEVFKKAGAKYVILTSKHHEGFTLWPSEQSWNWNSVDIGTHRDLCGDLSKAVKAKGLHMGFYYSLYEWFNPQYKSDPEKYISEHMLPQMKDLVTRYQPDMLYPDGEWDYPGSMWQSEKFLAWLYNESPVKSTVVVNDRWGKETRSKHGGYYSTEYGNVNGDEKATDMSAHPWEEIRGIGTSFGFNRIEDLSHYMSSEALVHMLIKIVSEGGNLCLNIGPTADGLIPVIMQQRLLDIGKWLQVNGEAIYGTKVWHSRPAAIKEQSTFYTSKGNDLYVICTRWPEKQLLLSGLKGAGKVTLLGSNVPVKSSYTGGKLQITPPSINPGNNPSEYAWVFKIENTID